MADHSTGKQLPRHQVDAARELAGCGTGLLIRSGLRAGSMTRSVSATAQAVVAAIPAKLLSFEA